MAGKRKANDENSGQFINTSGPPQKRPRRVPQTVTEASRMEAQRQWEEKQREEAAAKANFLAQREREEEAERRATSTLRIGQVLDTVKAAGYKTLHEFLADLLATKDQHQSSQVSQTLINHGDELLELIRARQPELVSRAKESALLWKAFRWNASSLMLSISHQLFASFFARWRGEEADENSGKEKRRDVDLVLSTVICMLVQTRNEKSSEYQTTMSFYLLACGATRSQFEVLNHAGICLSYRSTLRKVKDLGQERLAASGSNALVPTITSTTAPPRLSSFFGGFAVGDLPLEILPPRKTRLPVLEFTADDLLPSLEDVQQLETLHRWHIEDILVQAYPILRARFPDSISKPPSILIPVHTTEQCTLPAMQIDESSLDGTLFDKVAASRRDDIDLLDNLAGTRMTVNEHWGTPNSKSLWSLWKINSLLGRKPITAGWKSKKLPPFRPAYELMIDLTLPANILDGFRIICPRDTIEEWAESVPDWQSVRDVAAKVHQQLCSARRVSKLRRQPASKRDPIFENISLFNRDALTLLALRTAVKRGDVGGVLCVSAHWMVMFRGTGHMPKYADAIFRVLTELKSMHPKLREAYLMNWLANLSGKLLGFKEMDLLQEHQNFWLKVIYNARGSNRSWEWLGMISVSIFALRDVIRRVQLEYKIPHNSKSHSNPSTAKDIRAIRDYLELQKLQSVYPERADNDLALTARDLMETGAAYANTARAFKTFRPDNRKATNLGTAHGSACPAEVDDDEFADPDNYGQDLDLDLGDLVLDEEEFPAGIDPSDFVAMATEAILAMEETEL
ncbi:hypothetical protein B0H14DRAFT_3859029 [Mycena olivaceomarginata]|nr:hypothetical protein B0H14DRAFT_3859029 [Mycena olivaceomarginata]